MNLKELLHPDELLRLENNLDLVHAGEDQIKHYGMSLYS